MDKSQVIKRFLPANTPTPDDQAEAFAASNIALCKYWGKRDRELNLPINPSLSVSLADLGTRTRLTPIEGKKDKIRLNGKVVNGSSSFATKIVEFLDLFRSSKAARLQVDTHNSIPTAAGLASSASGFAALTKAINQLYGFDLDPAIQSAFARMGSGSASRSIFDGFVEWQMGVREDGMDSHAVPFEESWPEFRIGLLTLTEAEKTVGSRSGMQRTLETAHLYQSWPLQACADLEKLKQAIRDRNFEILGQTAEQNALSMHATMIASWPPLLYWQPESVATMQRIWQLRESGVCVYFTMDAGPNIKVLFEAGQQAVIEQTFPQVKVVSPFACQTPVASG
ncbi:diphosphomevalonate decarboxylase [Motiliproteus sp. MSK22-1]|uniref:diphosphomevalonate decarboxylase n=1 Tax=Motiliproteus sp. MSK22-1 TaxID=1897630 RepID=UPI0009782819|nr:diphosphomevalonate decarboxylase [Motiliproteus sp. MSK22-1]OMH33932.1 diphosphomevalonate decarboxylase [Motiliproteus sp. MSK22-1]